MSNITYIKGDMFTSPDRIYMHGCNAQGYMGAGVALKVKQLYPEAFKVYNQVCNTYKYKVNYTNKQYSLLGQVVPVVCDNKTILNAITQEFTGIDKRYVSYDAIYNAFEWVNMEYAEACQQADMYITIPKIGSGLGGGDWDIISLIIQKAAPSIKFNCYYI